MRRHATGGVFMPPAPRFNSAQAGTCGRGEAGSSEDDDMDVDVANLLLSLGNDPHLSARE